MAVKSITSGNDLMLFVQDASNNYKSIACATAHTLSISGESNAINSKDHGAWTANDVNKLSWEITSENLFTEDYDTLFTAMCNRTKLTVAIGTKSQSTTLDASAGLTAYTVGTGYKSGKCVITSLSLNANSGENATYSVTLTGSGALSSTGAMATNTNTNNGENDG